MKKLSAVLPAGMVYFIWLKCTGLGVPCVFRLVTGWKCPGCGVSTMILRLTGLNFTGALAANPFLFFTWPMLLCELIYASHLRRTSRRLPVWNTALLICYLAALLLFGILRNII